MRGRYALATVVAAAVFLANCVSVTMRVNEATTYNIVSGTSRGEAVLLGHVTQRDGVLVPRPGLPAGFIPEIAKAIENRRGEGTIAMTIDPRAQDAADNALGGRNGAIVVMDNGGAILAATADRNGWGPTTPRNSLGLAGLVTIAASPPQHIPVTEGCPNPLIDSLMASPHACIERISSLARASADEIAAIASDVWFLDGKGQAGLIEVPGSSFVSPSFCGPVTCDPRVLADPSNPVALTIAPLQAAGFAAFLATTPETEATDCPHLTGTYVSCAQSGSPHPNAIAYIRDAMKPEYTANIIGDIAFAAFRDPDQIWVIGYTPTEKPTRAIAVALDPSSTKRDAISIAKNVLTAAR